MSRNKNTIIVEYNRGHPIYKPSTKNRTSTVTKLSLNEEKGQNLMACWCVKLFSASKIAYELAKDVKDATASELKLI